MAVGAVELHGGIQRMQDYSNMKQNEDNKASLDQSHFQNKMEEKLDRKSSMVNQSEGMSRQRDKSDARDKGSNEYKGDGGINRRNNGQAPREGVTIKESFGGGFDFKV